MRGLPGRFVVTLAVAALVVLPNLGCGGIADLGSSDGSTSHDGTTDLGSPHEDAVGDVAFDDKVSIDGSSGDSSSADDAGDESTTDGSPDVVSDSVASEGAEHDGPFTEAGATTFTCRLTTCNSPDQYCYIQTAGPPPPPPPDGGYEDYGLGTCHTVPAACEPTPTCACIEKKVAPMCVTSCTDTGGAITARCDLP